MNLMPDHGKRKSKIENPKSKIVILGAGPAGLYAGLLIKKANPGFEIAIIERNPADVTYGWGVVFSDRTLASFQRADYKTYQEITEEFVIWDAIDVRYRGETIRCGGHVIASISRKALLGILQRRCAELGIEITYGADIHDVSELPACDLLVAADGVNSLVRRTYEDKFKPSIEYGKARYIWLGANKPLDAFNFIFHETPHGLFQVHAYPFSGTTSTFIVETAEDVWLMSGLDKASEEESLSFCQELLKDDLRQARLMSNSSKWISFPTLKTRKWHIEDPAGRFGHIVLLGDSVHTAHFSIGSGTKLAMEDSIALAKAIEQYRDIETALNEYEIERRPVVDTFQRAASESQLYFETLKRYLALSPVPFAFQLLTRSGRITYDDLHFRDARFGDMVDRWFAAASRDNTKRTTPPLIAPSPVFAPLRLRSLELRNRIVYSPLLTECDPNSKLPQGVGLFLTGICSISPDARITPADHGIYKPEHIQGWKLAVERAHSTGAKAGIQLGHAGRRGATRSRVEGMDRPLRQSDNPWPLVSASALPYTPASQVPREMTRTNMERVRDDFVAAARMALEAGFDLLQLHMAHGYLLASFFSPLTNHRTDEYGGELENRMRYPLEVFEAVRAVWPEDRPLSVSLTATDCLKGGFTVEEAVAVAKALKERGCDLIEVLAGQTTPDSEPTYSKGFLTHYSDRIRNEAGISTMVGGYLTTSNEANTILAAGRGDLCILT